MADTIVWDVQVNPGNSRAGAKSWAKRVTGLDTSKENGFALLGDFLRCGYDSKRRADDHYKGANEEGTFLLFCGEGGSWKNQTKAYTLYRVQRGEIENAGKCVGMGGSTYQTINADGCALVASSGDKIDAQAAINEFPDLATNAGSRLLPILYALKKAGI